MFGPSEDRTFEVFNRSSKLHYSRFASRRVVGMLVWRDELWYVGDYKVPAYRVLGFMTL